MKRDIRLPTAPVSGAVEEAFAEVQQSFERLCLAAGMEALSVMMEADVEAACGRRHGRVEEREAHRWGSTRGRIGFHGGKVAVERPRGRAVDGGEMAIPSWDRAVSEDWLGRWTMNLMLINVSTRRFGRAVRLPEGDVPAGHGSGVSKSAASRRFVALSTEKLDAFMSADLSDLDLLVIQIDGLHASDDLVLVAAIGIDAEGGKHPLALVKGATENTATVQALLDNLVERGLDPAVSRLFIVDGAKALSKAIRATFGKDSLIQRSQVHKARNIMDRLPKELHASTRRVLQVAGMNKVWLRFDERKLHQAAIPQSHWRAPATGAPDPQISGRCKDASLDIAKIILDLLRSPHKIVLEQIGQHHFTPVATFQAAFIELMASARWQLNRNFLLCTVTNFCLSD